MKIADILLPEFDDEMARTRKVLAAVPADSLDWQPAESLHIIGWNANHLAEIPSWTRDIVTRSEFDVSPPGEEPYRTPAVADPAAILEAFDRHVEDARKAIAEASDETFGETWTMKANGETLFTMPKGACVRTWVLNHSVHHRGILSVYLRMSGVESLYVYDG